MTLGIRVEGGVNAPIDLDLVNKEIRETQGASLSMDNGEWVERVIRIIESFLRNNSLKIIPCVSSSNGELVISFLVTERLR